MNITTVNEYGDDVYRGYTADEVAAELGRAVIMLRRLYLPLVEELVSAIHTGGYASKRLHATVSSGDCGLSATYAVSIGAITLRLEGMWNDARFLALRRGVLWSGGNGVVVGISFADECVNSDGGVGEVLDRAVTVMLPTDMGLFEHVGNVREVVEALSN